MPGVIPRRTCRERRDSVPSRAGRRRIADAPIECGPGKIHLREWRSVHADGGTHAHNTLSAEIQDVHVFYPFHPLHGATLQILRRPKRGDGAVCVSDPAGRRLKIPVWMLSRDCTEIKIAERAQLSKEALLSLASLIAAQLDPKDHVHDNLLQTVSGGIKRHRFRRFKPAPVSAEPMPKDTSAAA
jgi:hypothetical protein